MLLIDCYIFDSAWEVLESRGTLSESSAPDVVKSMAADADVSVERALKLWKKAADAASEKFEPESDRWWKYKVGAFKKMLGLDEEARAHFILDLDERLSDEKAKKWLDPNKSVLINNVWWTIKDRDLDKNKVTLELSTWAKADGVKDQPNKTMPFTSLVSAINKGKIGVRIKGEQHGPAQDPKERDKVRQKAGLGAAPGAAKFREDALCIAERVGAFAPHVLADAVERAIDEGRFDRVPVLYDNCPVSGHAASFVETFGHPVGDGPKSRLSWIASKVGVCYESLRDAFGAFRRSGMPAKDAMVALLEHAHRCAIGAGDLDEVESRRDALLQFVLQHDGKLPEFEAWLDREYPEFASDPEPLHEDLPDQTYSVPRALRESMRSTPVRGSEALLWQHFTFGKLTHLQLEHCVFEAVHGRADRLGDEALKWAIDAYTRIEEGRNRSRSQQREDQNAKLIPIPRNVRSRVRQGLMYYRNLGAPVSERELRLARRLNRMSVPYRDVAKLPKREHREVVDEDGRPDADTIKYWMRGGQAGVRWAARVAREMED